MDNQQRSSSRSSPMLYGIVAFLTFIGLGITGFEQLEKNGTFDSWANSIQK